MSAVPGTNLSRCLPRRWKDRWHRLSTHTKTAYKIAVSIGSFVVAVSGAFAYVAPSIEILPSVIGSDTDPSAAEFLIKNVGRFTLVNNDIGCTISTRGVVGFLTFGNVIISPGRKMSQHIDELPANATATRNCAFPNGFRFPATIEVGVTSRWPKYLPVFWWTSDATFISIKDAAGHVHIEPDAK